LVRRDQVGRGRVNLDPINGLGEGWNGDANKDATTARTSISSGRVKAFRMAQNRADAALGGTFFVRCEAAKGGPQDDASLSPCVRRVPPRY
jgi:hypothetical protein